MTRVKRIYLGVLVTWLLICGVRALVPWLGNFQLAEYKSGRGYFSTRPTNMEAGEQPAHIYAELNKRLEIAQPGTRFYFSPWEEWGLFICQGVIMTPIRDGEPVLSPEAKRVMQEWEQETGIDVWTVAHD